MLACRNRPKILSAETYAPISDVQMQVARSGVELDGTFIGQLHDYMEIRITAFARPTSDRVIAGGTRKPAGHAQVLFLCIWRARRESLMRDELPHGLMKIVVEWDGALSGRQYSRPSGL